MSYSIVQLIHLFAAIMFLGYIFTDVVILPALKRKLGNDEYIKIKQIIGKRAVKIFPITLLIIILSGGYMFSKYVNSVDGFFDTSLQKLLFIKLVLALVIVLGVVYSLSCKFLKKTPFAFMKNFHHYALFLGILIVILAKIMFIF